jgi:hypothetical protein
MLSRRALSRTCAGDDQAAQSSRSRGVTGRKFVGSYGTRSCPACRRAGTARRWTSYSLRGRCARGTAECPGLERGAGDTRRADGVGTAHGAVFRRRTAHATLRTSEILRLSSAARWAYGSGPGQTLQWLRAPIAATGMAVGAPTSRCLSVIPRLSVCSDLFEWSRQCPRHRLRPAVGTVQAQIMYEFAGWQELAKSLQECTTSEGLGSWQTGGRYFH